MNGKFFSVFSFVLGTLYLTLCGAEESMDEEYFRRIDSERICTTSVYDTYAICRSIDGNSSPECRNVNVDLLDGYSNHGPYDKTMLLCKKTMAGISYIVNCASGAHDNNLYYRWTWNRRNKICRNPLIQNVPPATGAAGTSGTTQEDGGTWAAEAAQAHVSQRGYLSPPEYGDPRSSP